MGCYHKLPPQRCDSDFASYQFEGGMSKAQPWLGAVSTFKNLVCLYFVADWRKC